MIEIDVVVNYCYNTIKLQLIHYIIEYKIICCVQTSIFTLLSYIASLEISHSA